MIEYILPAVTVGFILDLLVGDPHWLYHPVRLIGKVISLVEAFVRMIFPKTRRGEKVGGLFLVLLVVAFSAGLPLVILLLCFHLSDLFGGLAMAFMSYQILATRSLKDESMKVYAALKTGDIETSRHAVSMIVGRDTMNLSEIGVTKATVETIAENASDGVIAPLFYLMIGGPVLGFVYKGINTMDSMIGYKNASYCYLGRAAAKLDDLVNFIPARLSAVLMILAAFACKMNGVKAARVFIRDRYNHSSPNSAQTEAVMAGALEIQLAGNAYYFGKLYEKPTIGDPVRKVEKEDIPRANRLLYASAVLALLLFGLARLLLTFAIRGGAI